MTWIAVAVGGAIGSLARHAVNHGTRLYATPFPLGTMVVNVTGSFVIGLLAGLLSAQDLRLSVHWREFVFVGLLGGFTTFSTFSLDTLVLARTQPAHALLNVMLQVIGSLAAVWLGYRSGAALG
jgi:CrcB protein